MMLTLLLPMTLLSAPQNLDARMDVLRFHLERLHTIPVISDLEPEKMQKLNHLEELLGKGAESGEQVDNYYLEMDKVRTWLLANAVEKPSMPEGGFIENEKTYLGQWGVQNPHTTLYVDRGYLAVTIRTQNATWNLAPSDDSDIQLRDGRSVALKSARNRSAEPFHTGYSVGMRLSLSDFPDLPGLGIDIVIHLIGNEVIFELVPVSDIEGLAVIEWPKAVKTGNSEDELAVIPHMQGMLLPGNWNQEIHRRDLSNSRTLYMPWWGQISNGHGVQVILETSDDAGAAYDHPSGGPTHIQPLWYSSLGKIRYPRIIRYVFDDSATYVTIAKRYRRYVMETGSFVSLDEKRTRTPALNEVIGKPVAHVGALYHNVEGSRFYQTQFAERNHRLQTFDQIGESLRQLNEKGIDDAYVHLDGWGYYGYDNGHPDVIPPGYEQGGWNGLRNLADTCDELGYLLAVHDQYRDFYFNAVSFGDHLTIHQWDGTRQEHAEWAGGKQTFLSPRFAPGYVRRNHDAFREHGIKIRGAYLDVFAVVPLEESFQKSTPISRTDCARYRRECFDLLRARGYVVSSEEPADYLVPSIDLVHHGPYPTWPKGYGPGDAFGIPVPLFNLVYHDSVLLPWPMGDDGGWGIPNGDAGWLHCMLNAGLPYVSPGNDEQQIARVKEAASLATRLGTLEMTNHEFLDESRRVQCTTFSDGTTVTVDFERKTYTVKYAE